MDRERFETLVMKAVESLPEDLLESMENVDIQVVDQPTPEQLKTMHERDDEILLGLYEGIPLTQRGAGYGLVMPDRISIFQENIERVCRTDQEVVDEVRKVVIHEIAHHFGISDARLDELGWG